MNIQGTILKLGRVATICIVSLIWIVCGCDPKKQSVSAERQQGPLTKQEQNGPGKQRTLLSVWQSPNSSPQERADAINQYFKKGTDRDEIEALLGNGELHHFHGPSVDYATGIMGSHDEWMLQYENSNGIVNLRFRVVPEGHSYLFEHADVFVRLTVTPFSTNVSK
jgi:hypothetical protein